MTIYVFDVNYMSCSFSLFKSVNLIFDYKNIKCPVRLISGFDRISQGNNLMLLKFQSFFTVWFCIKLMDFDILEGNFINQTQQFNTVIQKKLSNIIYLQYLVSD